MLRWILLVVLVNVVIAVLVLLLLHTLVNLLLWLFTFFVWWLVVRDLWQVEVRHLLWLNWFQHWTIEDALKTVAAMEAYLNFVIELFFPLGHLFLLVQKFIKPLSWYVLYFWIKNLSNWVSLMNENIDKVRKFLLLEFEVIGLVLHHMKMLLQLLILL